MKKVKYPNLDDYDLSDYVELKGDILYKINGGAEIENSVEAQANASPGDTVTRKNGTTYTLTSGDIKWAQDYVGSGGTAGTTGGNSGQVCLSAETGISSQSTNSNAGTATASTTAVSGGATDSSSTQTSKSGTAKKIPIDHARNNELVDGWYEDCVTNLIARANGGIAGNAVKDKAAAQNIAFESDSGKRYNARNYEGKLIMTVCDADKEGFKTCADYYLSVGQYGVAGTPVYDGIGITNDKGDVIRVLKAKDVADEISETKHNIYSLLKGRQFNTEVIENNQLKKERDLYLETETSNYGWSVEAGVVKVSSKTLTQGPAARIDFDYFTVGGSLMLSEEQTKIGVGGYLVGFSGEIGVQIGETRFTVGAGIGLGMSVGFEVTDNSFAVDLGPLKGLRFSLENAE